MIRIIQGGCIFLILLLVSAPPLHAQSWVPVGGPFGGYVSQVTVGPDSHVFAVVDEKIFMSDDGGVTWQSLPAPEVFDHPSPVVLVAVLPAEDVPVLLAATQRICLVSEDHCYGGLYRSSDLGVSWMASEITPESLLVTDAGTVFASGAELLRSTDGGLSWVSTGISAWQTRIAAADGELVVAIENDRVHRSDDDGESWTTVSGISNPGIAQVALATDGTIFVLTASPNPAIYRLENDATAWEIVETPADSGLGTVKHIGNRLFIAGDGAFESVDGGKTWTEIVLPHGVRASAFAETHDGRLLVGSHRAGLWIRDGSGDFEALPARMLEVAVLLSVEESAGQSILLAATRHGGIHMSRDGGRSWEVSFGGSGWFTDLAQSPDGTLYAAGIGTFLRSIDGGSTWQQLLGSGAINSVAVAPDGTVLRGHIGRISDGVLRSVDEGATWEYLGFRNQSVVDIEAAPDGSVYASVDGSIYRWSGGSSWHLVAQGKTTPRVGADGSLLAYAEDAIHRSSDGGHTWSRALELSEPLIDLALHGNLAVARERNETHVSSDAGRTWASTVADLPPLDGFRRTLAIDHRGYAYAATSEPMIHVTATPVSTEDGIPAGAIAFELTAYPNPSSGLVNINVRSGTGPLTLEVFDVLGRRVAVIHDGPIHSFDQELSFDTTSLPAATYIIRGRSAETRVSRIMTVFRP